jgi:hypothetical protein
MHRYRTFVLAVTTVLVTATACSDSTAPADNTRPPADLNIARLATTSPPLFNPEESFYAKKGEDRELRIFFQDVSGGLGEEFLRLRIRDESLLSRPDGTPFAVGDSVLVTVRVVDATQILFEAEPAGLTFSPSRPAELKIHYSHADHDFNEDGTVNAADDQLKSLLAIWRQETPADPFIRLGSVNVEGLEEINADILGFTRFAIAY